MRTPPPSPYALLTLAILAASPCVLAACEADESLPSRPRTAAPFVDQSAQERAEKRALENPGKNVPTGNSGDAPRQLNQANLPTGRQVATLDADTTAPAQPAPAHVNTSSETDWHTTWDPAGNWHGPTSTYSKDLYDHGPIPHLPAGGTSVPMQGSVPVPDSPWSADFSWGQMITLPDAPHRAWPDISTHYYVGTTKHNPTYYFNLSEQLALPENKHAYVNDSVAAVIDVPWFYVNTALLPILMILEPPLVQRTTDRAGTNPIFNGYLPPAGTTVPTPTPGVLRWEYPFLNPDGSVKEKPTTNP